MRDELVGPTGIDVPGTGEATVYWLLVSETVPSSSLQWTLPMHWRALPASPAATVYSAEVPPEIGSPLASHWYSGDVGCWKSGAELLISHFSFSPAATPRPVAWSAIGCWFTPASVPSKVTMYGLLPVGSPGPPLTETLPTPM